MQYGTYSTYSGNNLEKHQGSLFSLGFSFMEMAFSSSNAFIDKIFNIRIGGVLNRHDRPN
jgi:hypothetical protein